MANNDALENKLKFQKNISRIYELVTDGHDKRVKFLSNNGLICSAEIGQYEITAQKSDRLILTHSISFSGRMVTIEKVDGTKNTTTTLDRNQRPIEWEGENLGTKVYEGIIADLLRNRKRTYEVYS